MTSISMMAAQCPECGGDILESCAELGLSYGDAEDAADMYCPHCNAELYVELLSAFQITTPD